MLPAPCPRCLYGASMHSGRQAVGLLLELWQTPATAPRATTVWRPQHALACSSTLKARRHVNRLCLAAGVPLVESGTAGFLGQVGSCDLLNGKSLLKANARVGHVWSVPTQVSDACLLSWPAWNAPNMAC